MRLARRESGFLGSGSHMDLSHMDLSQAGIPCSRTERKEDVLMSKYLIKCRNIIFVRKIDFLLYLEKREIVL